MCPWRPCFSAGFRNWGPKHSSTICSPRVWMLAGPALYRDGVVSFPLRWADLHAPGHLLHRVVHTPPGFHHRTCSVRRVLWHTATVHELTAENIWGGCYDHGVSSTWSEITEFCLGKRYAAQVLLLSHSHSFVFWTELWDWSFWGDDMLLEISSREADLWVNGTRQAFAAQILQMHTSPKRVCGMPWSFYLSEMSQGEGGRNVLWCLGTWRLA